MRLRIPVAVVLISVPVLVYSQEHVSAWAISVDNDWFAPTRTDRDYTAGIAFTYSSPTVEHEWNLLDRLLTTLSHTLLGLDHANFRWHTSALEFGVYGFTPDDISRSDVIEDDRPYGSLVYLSSSRSYPGVDNRNAWTTSLTIGMLGLNLFEYSQNAVHPVIGSDTAEGWKHQISNGGEPTFRYSIAYHDYLGNSRPDSQFKLTYFGSLGYLTEAGIALVFRDGLISSPSNRFNPELSIYGERTLMSPMDNSRESYLWGGVAIKGRLYNVFLEGQFSHSNHTIARSDLRHWLGEAWLGYTHSFLEHYKISYYIRVQSTEIKGGQGDRSLVWGGLVLSRSFR